LKLLWNICGVEKIINEFCEIFGELGKREKDLAVNDYLIFEER